MSEKKTITIKPSTRSLADRIKAISSIDDKNVLVDNGQFKKIAIEDGRDYEQMLKDDDYKSDFIAASALAGAELSRDHMKKNKDASIVSGSFEIGRSKMEFSIEKHQRVPNRVADKETGGFKVEGEKDLWGDVTVKYKTYGSKGSRGELKNVREYANDIFANAGFSS